MITKHPVSLLLIITFLLFGVFIFVSAGTSQPLYHCTVSIDGNVVAEKYACTSDPNYDCSVTSYCDGDDGWNDQVPTTTRWIDNGTCSEKQQKQQYYLAGTCSNSACVYDSSQTQWVNTGSTRNKDNTICAIQNCDDHDTTCRDYNNVNRYCSSESCGSASCTSYTNTSTGTSCGVGLECDGNGSCVDSAPPTITIYNAPEVWTSNNVDATIGCGDNVGCNSSSVQYSTPLSNPGDCSTIDGYAAYNGSGVTITTHVWMCAKASDVAGNVGYSSPVEFKVDQALPTSTITGPAAGSWQDADFTVSVTDSDTGGSELESCWYDVYNNYNNESHYAQGGSRTCGQIPSITSCTTEGTCFVQVYSFDNANNTSAYDSRTYNIDFTPPAVGQISIPGFSGPPFRVVPGQPVTLSALVLDPGFPDTGSGISSCGFNVNNSPAGAMTVSGNTASTSYAFAASDTLYQVHAACTDTVGNTQSGTDVAVNASTCLKEQIPLTNPATLPNECEVIITHLGEDATDDSSVSFESLGSGVNEGVYSNTIAMDDNPVSGCDNNFTWDTYWENLLQGSYNLSVRSSGVSVSASNKLKYGYEAKSLNCVVKDYATSCLAPCGNQFSSGLTNDHAITTTIVCNDGAPGCAARGDIAFRSYLNFVECTADSHCTPGSGNANSGANANTAKCNVDADSNGVGDITSNFNPNTCIDSVAPTSKITVVEDEFVPGNPPGFAPNVPLPGDYSVFLKAYDNGNTKKTWYVYVEDTDNVGGSGLDSCFISINGLELPRVCNTWASFTVGRPSTGAHCTSEGRNVCKIKVWAQDRAVNRNDAAGLEREIGENRITLTAPFSGDERKYNDFATYPNGFNVWDLGVDWTAPTAQ